MADETWAESSIELLKRVQGGDNGALERLCARYLPALQAWAAGRLPGKARSMVETGDLVQETLVHTIRNLDHFEHQREGALLAYCRTAVHNRIRSEERRAARHPEEVGLDETQVESSNPSPLDQLIGRDAAERYERALAQLREVEREAIIARLELRLPFDEVARLLGKPTDDAARMTFRRALARMAQLMKRAE